MVGIATQGHRGRHARSKTRPGKLAELAAYAAGKAQGLRFDPAYEARMDSLGRDPGDGQEIPQRG